MKFDSTFVRIAVVSFIMAGMFTGYYFLMPFVSIPLRVVENHWDPVDDPFSFEDILNSDWCEDVKEWENSWEVKFRNFHSFFQNVMLGDEKDTLTCEKIVSRITIPGSQEDVPIPIYLKVDGQAQLQFIRTEDNKIQQVLGNLNGPIRLNTVIVRNGTRIPLELLTRDIQMGKTSCMTNQKITLKLGRNGSMPAMQMEGTGMILRFKQDQQDRLSVTSIGSIELQHLDHVTLELTEAELKSLPWKLSPEVQKYLSDLLKTEKKLQIQLTCHGSVMYEITKKTLLFQKNVEISCKPRMQMLCEELTLKMRDKFTEQLEVEELPQPAVSSAGETASAGTSVGIAGTPVKNAELSAYEKPDEEKVSGSFLESLNARQITKFQLGLPSMDWSLEGTIRKLDYHFDTKKLELSSDTQFMLMNNKFDFSASNLSYTFPSAKEDKIGELKVEKSGNLTYKIKSRSENGRAVKLSWGQKLETFFDVARKVTQIQIFENVVLHLPEWNGFSNEEAAKNSENAVLCTDKIVLELRSKTEQEKQNEIGLQKQLGTGGNFEKTDKYMPVSLTAAGNVHLNILYKKLRLKGTLDQVTTKFQIPERLPDHLWQDSEHSASGERENAVISRNAGSSENHFLPDDGILAQSRVPNEERLLAMNGSLASAQIYLLPGRESVFVNCLKVEGNRSQDLILRDMSNFTAANRRFSIQAHQLIFWYLHSTTLSCEIRNDRSDPNSVVLVEGGGAQVVTSEVFFNLAKNHIEVPAKGKMTVLLNGKKEEDRIAGTQQVQIQWGQKFKYEMDHFQMEGDVQIETPTMKLNAARIRGVLEEAIPLVSFSNYLDMENQDLLRLFRSISAEDLETENGKDGVLVQFWKYRNGQIRDLGWLRTANLYLFPGQERQLEAASGKIWIAHWNKKENENGKNISRENENSLAAEWKRESSQREWYQMLAQYEGELTGNLFFGEFTISRNIKACGLATDTIETAIREIPSFSTLPPYGILFDCSNIEISQTPSPTPQQTSPVSEALFSWTENMQIELSAGGNVSVRGIKKDGGGFSINGSMMKYSQNRGVCTITGDGNLPVLITQQAYPGGPRDSLNADSVEIHQETMELKLSNIRVEGMLGPRYVQPYSKY